ncbi:MAG TPA: TonB-dependent siderophore receptor [Thermoanaerobaculia bacterium]|nr:TonB-dependent siderophore receptor [Thermoanaerobaculia bacterium]
MNKVAVALAVLLISAPLLAQEVAQEEEPPATTYEDVLFVEGSLPYVPESSTIAAKLPLPLLKTPASVGVVTGWLLEEQGSSVLGEALRNVSGVNVQTQSGVADFFVVRGFDSIANGLVLVDGAAEPEISFYQLYNVERVEVLKGPGGFLYGGSPIAATINMVRRQPEPGGFLSLDLTGGSFGSQGGKVDWNLGGEGDLGFRLNGLWQESDGYRDRPSEVRAVNPGFTWRPDESSSLHVNLELLDTSFAPDSGLPLVTDFFRPGSAPRIASDIADVPRTRSYQSPYDLSDQKTRRAQADYETQLSSRLTLRDKVYYRSLDWGSAATIFNGVFPTVEGSMVSRSLILLDDRQEFLGNQLEAVFDAKTGGVTHQLLAGVEVTRLTDRFTLDVGLLPDIGLVAPVELAQGPVFLIPGQSQAADAASVVIAPYVTDQIALSDRFQVLLGARFDSIDYQDDVTSTERSFSRVSPMLGLVWSPRPELSLYANAGRGFAPPSSRVIGKREPEESEQAEAGVKANLWGGKAQTTFALYELRRENVAIPDRTGITRQTGSQRSRGAELELAAEPLPRLRTFFSYAYTDAELTRFTELVLTGFNPPAFTTLDRSGNRPAFAPEHLANLWVSRRFGNGIGAGLGGRWLSEQFIAEDNAFELDDTFTLNAALFYDLRGWSLGLHFENLTGEEQFTRGFGATSVIPAPGFAVHGSLAYRIGLPRQERKDS